MPNKEEKVQTKELDIFQKLAKIQQELNVPKTKWNKFGEFYYRSCEDILQAIKPLLEKYQVTLKVEDKAELIGNWVYIEATAILTNLEGSDFISNRAYARESDVKKGMDASQLTGTASSYARKYALNGLLLLDDVKDADTDEYGKQTQEEKSKEEKYIAATEKQKEMIKTLFANDVAELTNILATKGKKHINELSIQEASEIIKNKKGE